MGGERSSTRRFSRVVLLVAALIIAVSLQGLTWGLVLEHGKTPIIGGPEVTEEDKITTSEAGPSDRVSILIHMTPGADSMPMQGFVNSQGAFVQYRYKKVLPNVINVRNFPTSALNGLLAIPGVERWKVDGTVHIHLNDSTPLIRGLQSQITGAGYSADGSGVRVCVLDTGIDSDSAMYSGRIDHSAGWDFVNGDNNPEDDHGHGSHVAGIAVGGTGLSVDLGCVGPEPFQGVAPKATLIGIKVMAASGSGLESDLIAGINYGADKSPEGGRCDVMNLSLGGNLFTGTCDSDPSGVAQAANNAVANGVVVVASSGNDGATNAMVTPACGSEVISVGATYDDDYPIPYEPYCEFPTLDPFTFCTVSFLGLICLETCTDNAPSVDQIGCYSNESEELDVTAPGCYTLSADFGNSPDGKVGHCGTSMAAPHVAGLAALLLNADPLLTPTDVRQLIRDGAIDLGATGVDPTYGYGRIDVINSLELVGPQPPCTYDADCDDGDICNGEEFCDATGICQAGTPVTCAPGQQCDPADGICKVPPECTVDADCDDGVACTVDTCDEVNATCVNTPDDAFCDDGNVCNGAETCDAANDCQPGTPLNCDDGNPCTTDSCDSGTCTHEPKCDDGLYCNGAETCVEGTCQAGTPPCDDGVACTVDTCDEVSDTCSNIPSHDACQNGFYCDGVESCDPGNGDPVTGCEPATTPVNCLPGYQCDEDKDKCVCTDDASCDDGNVCNGIETCDPDSDCQPGTPLDCDDGLLCTDDSCDPVVGCAYTPVQCPSGQQCDPADGICKVPPECTVNADCDDNLFCNGAETCVEGTCQAGTPPCDDGVACTVDTCDEVFDTCSNIPSHDACQNGFYCDGVESCDPGNGDPVTGCEPATTPVNCLPGYQCDEDKDKCVCTDDASCDDGNVCNGIETCDPDSDCQPGNPLVCEDGDLCTTDSCDQTAGCVFTPVQCPSGQQCDPADGICKVPPECTVDADCDDNLFCNGAEICVGGTCQDGTPPVCDDGVACTIDTCDEVNDTCAFTPSDAYCDDGQFCNGIETCDQFSDCQLGTPVDCNDDVGCTEDSCDEVANTCVNAPKDGNCDDNNVCNGIETCDPDSDCQPGNPLVCEDGDLCTTDSCDQTAGCVFTPVQCPSGQQCDPADGICKVPPECTVDADCDDNLFCNGAEICVGGTCQDGTPPVCDDGVACTIDTCDEVNDTCAFTPSDAYCDDANPCTIDSCDQQTDCAYVSVSCSNCFKGICDGKCNLSQEGSDCADCTPGCSSPPPSCGAWNAKCSTDADCCEGLACTTRGRCR